jgi:Polyketide cyclase / dehydrase and lipid transport
MKKLQWAVLGALALVPLFFSRRVVVMRATSINARPDEIFPLINDLRNWPRWTVWSQRENLHFTYEGEPAGVGAVQKWESTRMSGAIRMTESIPNEHLAYTLTIADMDQALEGIISIKPENGGSRVKWKGEWTGDAAFYARYMDLLFRLWIGRDFAAGLRNLKALAEQSHGRDQALLG